MPSSPTLLRDAHHHSTLPPPPNAPASAPILRLPTELLLAILARCVTDNPWDDEAPIAILMKAQWLALSAVCSHWHSVIMGTPTIWADICVWAIPTREDALSVELVQRALLRAGNTPLRVNIDVAQTYDAQTGRPIRRQIFAFLSMSSARWRALSLRVDPLQLSLELTPIRGKLPLLERLELARGSNANDRTFFAGCDLFEFAPALRSLTFEDIPPRVAWHQLKEVRMKITSGYHGHFHKAVYTALAFIEHCSALCSVVVWGITPPYHQDQEQLDDWPTTPLFKSPIRSLSLATFSRNDAQARLAGRLLRLLDLPNLAEFKLESTFPAVNYWDPAAFTAFAHRSPNMTVLHLRNVYISTPALLQALSQVPLLEDIAAGDTHLQTSYHFAITDEVLRGLLEPGLSLVPNLRRLEITSFLQFDYGLLLEVLRQRVQSPVTAGGAFVFCAVVLAMTKDEVDYGERANEGRLRLERELRDGCVEGLRFTVDADVL
ncbi:F-box domain-containing protein [Mycena indigotica]|uniref:F-box domain-containing protein n=1 Tax=Mycena indigotica TaxID=2126181 RepID=A0A8H6S399_9AGAR|nr:F-box domain-containing protein [Mycena indigotica]KAF7291450.1 F-box domain-containing protein [Mycena indigotica]